MKPHVALLLLVPSLVAASCATASAKAEVTAPDKASAEALFNEGIALVNTGRVAEACAKFEGSQTLDPTLGTELRLADCYQRLGKTASAWALFKECQSIARQRGERGREDLARERVEALAPRLSYLVIESDEPQLPGLSIRREGRPLPIASLGAKIPIDPGAQRIEVTATDRVEWTTTVNVPAAPGEWRVRIPRLKSERDQSLEEERAALAALDVAPLAQGRAPAGALRLEHAPRSEPPHTQRTIGIVTTIAGLVGVSTGAGLAWYAKRQNDRSRSNRYCPEDDQSGCTEAGLELRSRASAFAKASTVTLIASGAVLVTGIVVWSTAATPSSEHAGFRLRTGAAPSGLHASLEGTF
jgi:hypothetical protein